MKTLTILLSILIGALIVAVPSSHAQETVLTSDDELALIAFPPRMGHDNSLLLRPGETRQVELRVRNSSTQTLTIRSVAQDFIIGEDGSTPVPIEVEEANNRWSLASWLTVTPNGQTIAPQETKALSVLITVPDDALPGGHYAMITHQPSTSSITPEDAALQQQTGVNQRVGTLLYVIVDGRINEQAFIRDFEVPQFLEFGPVPFSFVLENESDVHIRPLIGVNISNIFGKKIANIQPDQKNIFPFTNRSFAGEWDRTWGFGRYKAEVLATYGTQQQLVMASSYFWLLPIKLISTIIVVVLLLVLCYVAFKRERARLKQEKAKKIAELESKVKEMENQR